MVALCNRADHYIFILFLSFFFFFFFFFPRLISYFGTWYGLSVNLKCRSEMRCTRLAANTGHKNHHLGTIAQLCRAISSQLRHVSTIGKKLAAIPPLHVLINMVNLRPTNGWDLFRSLGHPYKFQPVLRLGSVTARHLVVGVSQTLRRWTEGATYVWQGDHQVGHWPTF